MMNENTIFIFYLIRFLSQQKVLIGSEDREELGKEWKFNASHVLFMHGKLPKMQAAGSFRIFSIKGYFDFLLYEVSR